jgi:hypothetical protein
MSKRKIKRPRNVKYISESVNELGALRSSLLKLTEENKLLNGEVSNVLEELLSIVRGLEDRIEKLEGAVVAILEDLTEEIDDE